ncbi:uncharacterized protein LOC128167412 isoform X5 [Crassostrea angulata]|uniref:uncharacterized protein LOC128167412 isoform X5 n=1 Tax=Magallana angulata TaxID=2784310 RepID=UPI0022B1CE4E|nr:uncharacterized protein LOC128167412 isoform X5 [Crassostrea angulata]
MDNREKRPIFDLKKSNSLISSISIKDPKTGRNVLDEILQEPAENYKEQLARRTRSAFKEQVLARLSEGSFFESTQQIEHIQDSKDVLPLSIVDPNTGKDVLSDILKTSKINKNQKVLFDDITSCEERIHQRASIVDPSTGDDKWIDLFKNENIKKNAQELENKRKRNKFIEGVRQKMLHSRSDEEFQSWNDYVYQDNEEENSDASFSSDWGQYEYQDISSVSQRYTTFNDYIHQEEVDADTPYSSVYAFGKTNGYVSAFSQEYAFDDDFNNQDDEYVSETSDYPCASDSEKHNDGNAVAVKDDSKSEHYEGIIDMRESGQFLENGDNYEDTKIQVTEITKESTLSNEIDKELPAGAEITNTSEPVLFNHQSCVIAGWKGSGKTTVVQLLESERWDDIFEDNGNGLNGKEKPNSMQKNSVSFVEISNSPLCKVLPILLAPVTVGILVIDMTKTLKETMDSGSNTTGFSKLTYRDYIASWLHIFQNICTSKVNIILVGTHADGYSETDAIAYMDEILKLVDNKYLDKICLSKEMTFTISSQKAGKEECSFNKEKLKACVQSQLLSYGHLRKPVPMRWISWFEVLVETCQQENKVTRIDKLWMLNEKFPKENRLTSFDEMKDVLALFSDTGKIIFEGQYCNIAVLDIQYIVDVVSIIMSSQIKTGEITSPVLQDMLIQTCKPYCEESALYLEAIGLASKFPSEDVWYFPTLNAHKFPIEDFKNFKTSSVFCFKFNCHARLIFHMLVCMCLSINKWSVLLDGKMKCVYKNVIVFSVKSHNILIRTRGNKIQVQILWLHKINVDTVLISEIMKKIGSLLDTIKARNHANIKFETGFECGKEPLGKDEDTFISFEEANGSRVIQCPRCPVKKSHPIDVQSITEFWMHGEQQNNIVRKKDSCSKKIDGTRFKKASLKTTDAKVSDFKSEISKRVGMIRHQDSAIGTGFRVGKNKVMTCWHVIGPYITENTARGCELDVKGLNLFNILFQFKDRNEKCHPRNYFRFIPYIHFYDKELDVIVLELERHQFTEVEFPPPIRFFGEIDFNRELHLIGHPGGVQMKEDSQVSPMPRNEQTHQFILELEKWSVMHFPNNENFYSPLHDACKVLLHTTFDRGSSGSPGINIDHEKAIVVLMLSGGVPTCFYDGIYTNIPHDKLVEYGVSISDIYNKMEPENPKLCNEIFNTCN